MKNWTILKKKNWKLSQKQVIKQYKEKQEKWEKESSLLQSPFENEIIIVSFINGKVVKNSSLWEPFTDLVTYFKSSLSIQFHLPMPFLKERYSHALILQTIPDPLSSHQWACPGAPQLLPLPYPSFPSLLLLLNHPAKKLQVMAQRSGWKEPSGAVNSFSTPSILFGYNQIPFSSLCNVHVPKSILHRSEIWIGFINLQA